MYLTDTFLHSYGDHFPGPDPDDSLMGIAEKKFGMPELDLLTLLAEHEDDMRSAMNFIIRGKVKCDAKPRWSN